MVLISSEKETTQFDASGEFGFKHDTGVITLKGLCAVKDGTVKLYAEARPDGHPMVDVNLARVPLDARLGPILELLHPALSAAGGNLDGAIDGSLALQFDGPLDGA